MAAHVRLNSVGTMVRQIREEQGLTPTDLANKVGMQKQHIYKIERDIQKNCPYSVVKRLADGLNVNPAYLVGWSTSKERTPDIIPPEGIKKEDEFHSELI